MQNSTTIASLILPSDILCHFELIKVIDGAVDIRLFLDEKGIKPIGNHYQSKGFTEQRIIQDFPIRGKSVYLHIRRRKWQDTATGMIITNKLDLSHSGTQLSKEFAAFLKDIHRG